MSKLFTLKKWLTLDDAATHLSTVLKEEVTVADILQLAIDRHLTLSINLVNHAEAKIGKAVSLEQAKLYIVACHKDGLDGLFNAMKSRHPLILRDADIPEETKASIRQFLIDQEQTDEFTEALSIIKPLLNSEGISLRYDGQHVPDRQLVIELNKPMEVQTIDGIWDLPLIGSEELDIQHKLYHQELGGPEITLINIDGTWLVSENGDEWAQLQDRFDNNEYADKKTKEDNNNIENRYFPAGGLPEDAIVLVRKNELHKFIESLSEPEPGKVLTQREKTTYLNIIGGLLQQLTKSPSCNQETVKITLLEELNGLPGISKSTIENKFSEANKSIKTSH